MSRLPLAILGAVAILLAGGCPSPPQPGDAVAPTASASSSASPQASVAPPAGDDAAAADAATTADVADAGAGRDAGNTVSGAAVVTIDDASNGKTIDLARGQKLVIALRWSPSSGYDWEVKKSPKALGTPEATVVSAGDVPGAFGQRRFAFTATDTLPAGEHTIELVYRRSFEKDKPPAKTFSVKVRAAH